MSDIFTKTHITKIEPTMNCESICAFRDRVLVGTKQGTIIVYSVNFEKPDDKTSDIKCDFCFMIRDFNKKPVTQIELAEEFGIFLSLSFGTIFVHRINDYKLIYTTDVRNISNFCIDFYQPVVLDKYQTRKMRNESQLAERQSNEAFLKSAIIKEEKCQQDCELRICVVAKRKLIILLWDRSTNCFKMSEKKLPDYHAIAVQFLFEFLCIGTKYEYHLVNIESGETKFLFNVGKSQEPFIMRVSDMLGIKIDDTVEFIDKEGNTQGNANLRWSFMPSILLYHPPFAVALHEKYIEVRMISPTMLIQSLPVENASLICRYMDKLYVLADKKLLILLSKSRFYQVKTYAKSKDFEVALILAKTASLVGETEIDCTEINIKYALSLYENRQFEQAFDIFTDMNTDPQHVLNLFPSLCPEKTRNIINLSNDIPSAQHFTDCEKKEAIRALIDYLVKWRLKLRKMDDKFTCTTITGAQNIEVFTKKLKQIVDTTLVKCYLSINSPLVAPLLRQENFCHVGETVTTLEKYDKYQELVILYENNNLHDSALDLLHTHSSKTHSTLYGIHPTLNYLKNLNYHNLDLIYQYGDWILQKSPMDWLSIFTYWYQKEKMASCDKKTVIDTGYKDNILDYLERKFPDMVIPFLERIIYDTSNMEDLEFESGDVLSQSCMDQSDQNLSSDLKSYKLYQTFNNKLLPFDVSNLPIIEDPFCKNVTMLHNCYVKSLIQAIMQLRHPLLLNLDIEEESRSTLPDSKYVYNLRIRLKMFLQSPNSKYNADFVLSCLPYDAFNEERALMLARTNKHEQALTLWIYLLKDWKKAVEHCTKVYQTNRNIFYKLLAVCIEPSDPASLGIVLPKNDFDSILDKNNSILNKQFDPKLDKPLEIMRLYGDKLNPLLTMKLVSSVFLVKDLLPFIKSSLRKQSSQLNESAILRNLVFYNKLWSNFKACISAKKSFIVDKSSKCFTCKKLMGSSAFVRTPNGILVHYGCSKDISKIKI